MQILHRKHRDSYLDSLSAEPLFRDVPRHLLAVVGRAVDRLDLAAGDRACCDSARETIVIADGHVLLTDGHGVALGVIGPGSIVAGSSVRSAHEPQRITALSRLRAFVIARRELGAVTVVAPGIAAAVAGDDGFLPVRVTRAGDVDVCRSGARVSLTPRPGGSACHLSEP